MIVYMILQLLSNWQCAITSLEHIYIYIYTHTYITILISTLNKNSLIKNQLRGNISWVRGPSLQLVLRVNKIVRKSGFVNSLWIRLIKDTFTVGPLVVQRFRITCQGRGHRFCLVREGPTCGGAAEPMSRSDWTPVQTWCSARKGGATMRSPLAGAREEPLLAATETQHSQRLTKKDKERECSWTRKCPQSLCRTLKVGITKQ